MMMIILWIMRGVKMMRGRRIGWILWMSGGRGI